MTANLTQDRLAPTRQLAEFTHRLSYEDLPDHVVDFKKEDPVEAIMRLTDGRGVDVAIEALGTQTTFEAALRVIRPGGVLSSLGVYSSDLKIPLDAFAAGLGDKSIRTSLCPGGKERMRRMLAVISSARARARPTAGP